MKKRAWTLVSVAAAGLAAAAWTFLVYVPRQVVYAERWPVTQSPADVGVQFEDVMLRPADEAIELAGWWMPAEQASAALVFIHGGSSNRHTSYFKALEFYREMVGRGVSILSIDLRNHGASGAGAGGIQFGRTEKEDAKAAVAWTRQREPDLPLFAMGISMGGATLIYAAAEDLDVDGLILLDPLLDTGSCFRGAVHATVPIPDLLLYPSSWSAVTFFGLPGEGSQALDVGKTMSLPTLLIQDPGDPVTVAVYARELASANPSIEIWMAPDADPDHPELEWKGRWGSHVGAFAIFPESTVTEIVEFMGRRGMVMDDAGSSVSLTTASAE